MKCHFRPRAIIQFALVVAVVGAVGIFMTSDNQNYASILWPAIPEKHYKYIDDAVERCGLPKSTRAFFASMAKHESTFNERAVSSAGAVGIIQVLPGTGYGTAVKNNIAGYNAETAKQAEMGYLIGICHAAYLGENIGNGDPANWNDPHFLKAIAVGYNAGLSRGKSYYANSYNGPRSSLGYANNLVDRGMKVYALDFDRWDQQQLVQRSEIDILTEIRESIWKVILGVEEN